MDNQAIARRLSDYAAELYAAHGDFYRVRAYRWAAEWVRSLDRPLQRILETEGRAGLEAVPGVGAHIAFTIEELIRSGEFKTWCDRTQKNAAAIIQDFGAFKTSEVQDRVTYNRR